MRYYYNPMYLTDEVDVVNEVLKINNEVKEELAKPSADKKKLYELRFQQLMKGIQITSNPYNIRY